MELLRPWMLLTLAGLLPLWWWQRHSLAGLSPTRRRLSLALRAALLGLVALALAEPRWIQPRHAAHVCWIVDRSHSVGDAALAAARKFTAPGTRYGRKIDSQSWIAFGGQPVPEPDLGALAQAPLRSLDENATDIAGALALADATFPAGYTKTAVLFSDGQETQGEVATQIERLRQSGVRVDVVPVAPPDKPEMLVRAVSAPRDVKDDEPFKVGAEIISNRTAPAEISLFRNGARVATQTTTLHPGANHFESTQAVSGEHVFEFAVEVRPKNPADDTLADNNSASTYVQSAGKSKVLLLADKPEQARYLALALRQEGILLDVRPAAGAPSDLGDLQNYDLLILDNVPATDLSPDQMRLMAGYVREFGGGLLMMGGDQAFGLGGYYQTPIEEVLPVRCDFQKEQETPSLGMMIVIDRSGSMTGPKIEMVKDAAKGAVELLSPRDYCGVVAFDDQAFSVAEMTSVSDKDGLLTRIASIEPGGGTNIAAGLELGYSQISGSPAKIKHVILLTDGVSTPGPFYELTTRMAGERITVSTVAVGADADRKLCEQIAEWGNGRSYFTDDPGNIPQIFARETMTASKSAIQEAPFLPVIARPADFLSGIDFQSAPFLLGYVTTRPKPTAENWLVTERGEPLLSTWRYGLGQTGAFTSDARNRWAVEWLKWDRFGKFWAQVVRRLARTPALTKFPVEIRRERGGFRAILDTADGNGEFLTDVGGEIAMLDPHGHESRVPLTATEPGRLEAWWAAPDRGAYNGEIVLRRAGSAGDEPLARQFISAAVGYPDEFQLRPIDETLLRHLAQATGGQYNPAPADLFKNDARSAGREIELWPWLLGLCAFLFIFDVAIKRWPQRERSQTGAGLAAKTVNRDLKVMPA
jgi:Ca-activated chloride channel family protein